MQVRNSPFLGSLRKIITILELVSNSVSLPESIPGDRWREMRCYHNPIYTETSHACQAAKQTEIKSKGTKCRPPRPMLPVKSAKHIQKDVSGKENRVTPLRPSHPPGPLAMKSNTPVTTPFNFNSVTIAQYISPKDPMATVLPFSVSAQKSCIETPIVAISSDAAELPDNQAKPQPTLTSRPWRVTSLKIREVTLPAVPCANKDKLTSLVSLRECWVAEALRFIDSLESVELQRCCDIYVLEASRAVMQLGNDIVKGTDEQSASDTSVSFFLRNSLTHVMVRYSPLYTTFHRLLQSHARIHAVESLRNIDYRHDILVGYYPISRIAKEVEMMTRIENMFDESFQELENRVNSFEKAARALLA